MTKTSVSRSAKELANLREDIRKRAGFQYKTLSPSDFDFLESDIKRKLSHVAINAKTLKRLFGYDKTDTSSDIRLYTLDVLSQYVGYESWDDYLVHLALEAGAGSGDFNDEHIGADSLGVGDTLQIAWLPDRKSTLKYLGNQLFEITETKNSKWQVGDRFQCRDFIAGKPLYIDNLTDKSGTLKAAMFVVGKKGGIRLVKE